MLGTGVQTTSLKPLFPILCHEKFRFHQTFYEIKKLKELDTYLSKYYFSYKRYLKYLVVTTVFIFTI